MGVPDFSSAVVRSVCEWTWHDRERHRSNTMVMNEKRACGFIFFCNVSNYFSHIFGSSIFLSVEYDFVQLVSLNLVVT